MVAITDDYLHGLGILLMTTYSFHIIVIGNFLFYWCVSVGCFYAFVSSFGVCKWRQWAGTWTQCTNVFSRSPVWSIVWPFTDPWTAWCNHSVPRFHNTWVFWSVIKCLLNDGLWLVDELPSLAGTCSLRSVIKVQTLAAGCLFIKMACGRRILTVQMQNAVCLGASGSLTMVLSPIYHALVKVGDQGANICGCIFKNSLFQQNLS